MAEVGSAYVTIMPSARGFGRNLGSQVSGETRTVGSRIGKTLGSAMKVGAVAALGGAALLGGFVATSVKSLARIERINTQTATVIKSTGGAAGVSAKHVENLAGQLENLTATEAESTQEGANLLLTFTNVRNEVGKGNDIFDRATTTLVDMGRALGQDAKSSAVQLGKALNDPIKGVTALQRVGVSFTAQQKDQIAALVESGKTLDAQKIILRELNKEFGGSGKAFAQTTEGQIELAKHAFGTLGETISAGLLPPLGKAAGFIADLLNGMAENAGPALAAIQSAIAPIRDALTSAFSGLSGGGGGAASFLASLVPIFLNVRSTVTGLVAAFVPFVQAVLPSLIAAGQRIASALVPALTTITGIIANQLVPAFKAILPVLAPIVSFLVGVFAGAVVGAINGVVQTIKGVVGIIAGVVNLVKALIHGDWAAAWAALKQIVVGAFNAVVGAVKTYLNIGILRLFGVGLAAIRGLWAGLWGLLPRVAQAGAGAVRGVAAAFFNFIRSLFLRGVQAYVSIWRGLFNALLAAARAGMAAARGVISSAMAAIRSLISSAMNAIRSLFTSAWNAIRSGVTTAFNAIKNAVGNGIAAVINLVKGIPGKAASALGNLGSTLYNAGAELIQGLINGISSKIAAVADKMSDLASKVKGFLPGSPVREGPLKAWNNTGPTGPGGQLVGMLAKGMGNISPIQVAAKDLAGTIAENFRADTFADNFTLHGAVSSLRADAKRASEFSQAARRAKKLGLDGGLLKDVLASGNTALLQDITSTEDVRALERAWRARNKATDFFGKDDEHTKRLEDAVERGAEKGTRKGSGEHRKRENAHRRSKARRAAAP